MLAVLLGRRPHWDLEPRAGDDKRFRAWLLEHVMCSMLELDPDQVIGFMPLAEPEALFAGAPADALGTPAEQPPAIDPEAFVHVLPSQLGRPGAAGLAPPPLSAARAEAAPRAPGRVAAAVPLHAAAPPPFGIAAADCDALFASSAVAVVRAAACASVRLASPSVLRRLLLPSRCLLLPASSLLALFHRPFCVTGTTLVLSTRSSLSSTW